MEELKILGNHFSNKEVEVKFLDNITPQTDGKKILLPANMPRKVVPSVLTTLMHESYHIRKDSKGMERDIRKAVGRSIERDVLHHLLNIVEDVRIDKMVLSDYKGARGLYEQEFRRLAKKNPSPNPMAQVIACAITEAEGFSSVFPAPPKEFLPLKEKILTILQRVPTKPRGSRKKIKEIIEDLYGVLKDYFQKSPQKTSPSEKQEDDNEENEGENIPKTGRGQITEGETSGEKKEGGNSEQQNGKQQQEEKEQQEEGETEEQEEEQEEQPEEETEEKEQQQEDEVEEKEEQQQEEENSNREEDPQPLSDAEINYRIEETIKEWWANSVGIHQLEKILQEEKEDIREVKISPAIARRLLLEKIENTKGNLKINMKKISSLYTSPARIFQKTQKKTEKTTLYLVIDNSGSMSGCDMEDSAKAKIEVAKEALFSIVKATQGISRDKLDLRILFFNDITMPYPSNKILQKNFPIPCGATDPMSPLREIAKEMDMEKEGNRKVRILFLTDAEFHEVHIEEMGIFLKQRPSILFTGVLIGDSRKEELIRKNINNFHFVKKTRDLESVFARIL